VPRPLSSIGVYCGSSPGVDPAFATAAATLGRLIAERGLRLVYGGGHIGLMGILADAALAAGGEVHGVITRTLEDAEVAHRGLSRLDVVDTMHERKALMSVTSDAFVMLPGGFGTLDEFFEAVTWTQLGIHDKRCGVLDVHDYFASLRAFIDVAWNQEFIRPRHREIVLFDNEPAALLDRLTD
jgi:uncharacterized protein (TIGR00730 family)